LSRGLIRPVRVGSGSVELDLPKDTSLEEARRINDAGQARGGIERIHRDGTVHATAAARSYMQEVLVNNAAEYRLYVTEGRANDLQLRFATLLNQ